MRFLLITLAVASVLTVTAYSSDKVMDHMTYANGVSHTFAAGDNSDASGWRECSEVEDQPPYIGVVCDGTRVIKIHGGQRVDVNYFCEFQFKKLSNGAYRVKYALCQ